MPSLMYDRVTQVCNIPPFFCPSFVGTEGEGRNIIYGSEREDGKALPFHHRRASH